MNWTQLLKSEMDKEYAVTEKLFDLVDDSMLDWKPSAKNNWMTTGQLLLHIAGSTGMSFRGFATGDWGMPEDFKIEDLKPEEMLPPAEKMPGVESVAQAKQLLADDKEMAVKYFAHFNEDNYTNDDAPVPWDMNSGTKLGQRLLQMIDHMKVHKAQLFYYLKLQGKPVNTSHLWGM